MKSLPSGIKVTTFSLATNRVWKNKDGATQEGVDYHNIVAFRQAGGKCGSIFEKRFQRSG